MTSPSRDAVWYKPGKIRYFNQKQKLLSVSTERSELWGLQLNLIQVSITRLIYSAAFTIKTGSSYFSIRVGLAKTETLLWIGTDRRLNTALTSVNIASLARAMDLHLLRILDITNRALLIRRFQHNRPGKLFRKIQTGIRVTNNILIPVKR